jgi:uncharacterized protein YggT (Ycf19 family)
MLDLQTIYILLGILGFFAVVTVFGWKASWWAGDRFREIRELIYKLVQELENKFDNRHMDNIQRFTRIETKLDIINKNGYH